MDEGTELSQFENLHKKGDIVPFLNTYFLLNCCGLCFCNAFFFFFAMCFEYCSCLCLNYILSFCTKNILRVRISLIFFPMGPLFVTRNIDREYKIQLRRRFEKKEGVLWRRSEREREAGEREI